MTDSTSWRDEHYDTVYNNVLSATKMRLDEDESFGIDQLEQLLRDQYIYQEQGWAGKMPMEELTNGATIAAYEAILAEYRTAGDE